MAFGWLLRMEIAPAVLLVQLIKLQAIIVTFRVSYTKTPPASWFYNKSFSKHTHSRNFREHTYALLK